MRMQDLIRIVEEADAVPVLYHGTCANNAANIIQNGWAPRSGKPSGANMGQPRYLYLSTDYEDALWFAEEKGCNTVIEIHNVSIDHLIVDPEDGSHDTVQEELKGFEGMPGKVALTKPLSADHFKLSSR